MLYLIDFYIIEKKSHSSHKINVIYGRYNFKSYIICIEKNDTYSLRKLCQNIYRIKNFNFFKEKNYFSSAKYLLILKNDTAIILENIDNEICFLTCHFNDRSIILEKKLIKDVFPWFFHYSTRKMSFIRVGNMLLPFSVHETGGKQNFLLF